MTLLYRADPSRAEAWRSLFAAEAPEIDFRTASDAVRPEAVKGIVAFRLPAGAAAAYPNLEAVFCSGAGVDLIDAATLPPEVKLVRMIEPNLRDGMVEYVTFAVLGVHRDLFAYEAQQARREWKVLEVRPASAFRVGVMGTGILGRAVLENLRGRGYRCAGWSRSPHAIEGVECYAGPSGLGRFLERTDILVCLLPLTHETRGILGAELFARLPRGATVINVGRGGHLVQPDLLAALDSGQVGRALLDVTDPEPLPAEHPLWVHPRVRITPHIASETQVETAARAVMENVRRLRRGEAPLGLVDRARGY